MRYIRNTDDRLMFRCFIVVLIGVIFLVFVLLVYRFQLKNYKEVDAIIEGVYREEGSTSTSDMSVFYYVSYSFSYNGHDYVANRQILLPFGYKAGKNVTIKISPKDPEKLENVLLQQVCIVVCIIGAFFLLLEFPYTIAFLRR